VARPGPEPSTGEGAAGSGTFASLKAKAPHTMPFTPFHAGPGALLHALAPQRVSFLAFCVANILIDLEPLYYIVSGQWPLHRFWHTLTGAALVLLATVLLFIGARRPAAAWRWVPDVFGWQALPLPAVALGAGLGSFSHLVFDAVMHADLRPLAPFSDHNPLLHVMPLGLLHLGCLAAGALGLLVLVLRRAWSAWGRGG